MGILDVKVIKSKPNSDEAQTMMEKIVAQVTPIMKRHSWRVVMLQEVRDLFPEKKAIQ